MRSKQMLWPFTGTTLVWKFNPIALRKAKIRKAKIVCNFGLSERNRVNEGLQLELLL